MEICQHFCDVLIPHYNIVILYFHYHAFNITLYGIFFEKIAQKLA
jgi:hypothetical protein